MLNNEQSIVAGSGKGRISYIDVMKGILIIMVVAGHVAWSAKIKGIDTSLLQSFKQCCVAVFGTWYMPCFFAITGYCSNFSKDLKTFVYTNLATLILPAFIVAYLRPLPWFCVTLFISKLMYYFVWKYVKKRYLILGIALLSSIASCLASFIFKKPTHEPYYIWHALGLFPYLCLGQYVKYLKKDTLLFIACPIYFIVLGICLCCHVSLPTLSAVLDVSFSKLLLHWILATTGTLTMFAIVKYCIPQCRLLEYLGRNSLFIYLLHVYVIHTFWCIPIKFGLPIEGLIGILLIILCVIFSILISLIGCEIVNTKYFCWIKGKFD